MDISLNQSADSCRCCLKSGNLVPIFDEYINEDVEIAKAIIICIPAIPQITRNDGYSQNICIDCKHDLQQFYNFREMCITTDENIRSSRRPTSRNNEHDYSTLNDDYVDDMDLSQYLINSSLNHIEGSDPDLKHYDAEQLTVEPQIEVQPPEPPVFDDTQNFDAPQNKYVPKRYACPICHKLWVSPSKLKRHMTVHNRQPTVAKAKHVQLGTIKTRPVETTTNHKTTDTRQKPSSDVKPLQAEVKQEPLDDSSCTKFVCLLCGVECSSQSRLQHHMSAQHLRNFGDSGDLIEMAKKLTRSDTRSDTRRYKEFEDTTCPECHKTFESGIKLRRHMKIHDSNRSYKARPRRHECQHCLKKFETPSKLLRHMSVHRKKMSDSEPTLEISAVTSILGD